MKAKINAYIHVKHNAIVGFRNEEDGIYVDTLHAEIVEGLVYQSKPDWFPIQATKVEPAAPDTGVMLLGYSGRITYRIDMETLQKQFPNFVRKGKRLKNPTPVLPGVNEAVLDTIKDLVLDGLGVKNEETNEKNVS